MFAEMSKNWNWNTFYSVLTFGGLSILILGLILQDYTMTKFGFVTFVYGILSWMLCNGFYIKAKFSLPQPSINDLIQQRKRTDWIKVITIAISLMHILLFVVYVIIASLVLFGKQ